MKCIITMSLNHHKYRTNVRTRLCCSEKCKIFVSALGLPSAPLEKFLHVHMFVNKENTTTLIIVDTVWIMHFIHPFRATGQPIIESTTN